MRTRPRTLALAALTGFALLAAGCSSNNKGKVEGRWKFVTFPESTEAQGKGKAFLAALNERGAYFMLEFRPDGTMTLGVGSGKPEVLDQLKAVAAENGQKLTGEAKFKLLPGDGVEFYDLPAEFRGEGSPFGSQKQVKVQIKITGNEMTLVASDGTATLTRLPKE
jgi:hypothetical protein